MQCEKQELDFFVLINNDKIGWRVWILNNRSKEDWTEKKEHRYEGY